MHRAVTLLVPASLALAASLAPGQPPLYQERPRGPDPRWAIGDGRAVRYRLTLDAAIASAAPVPSAAIVVEDPDFADHARPVLQARDVAALVWWLSLAAPGSLGARGEIGLSLPAPTGTWELHGRESVASDRGEPRFSLSVQIDHREPGHTQAAGRIAVERAWSPSGHELERARFVLEIATPSGHVRRSGEVARAGRLTTDGALEGELAPAIDHRVSRIQADLAVRVAAVAKLSPELRGASLGPAALEVAALLRAGVPPKELDGAFAALASCPFLETYGVSLYTLALEARTIRRLPPEPGARGVARWVRSEPSPEVRAELERAAAWLAATRHRGFGSWRYRGDPENGASRSNHASGDHSNSQFAVLGLFAALGAGVDVPPGVWAEVAQELVGSQEKAGPETSLETTEWTGTGAAGLTPDVGVDLEEPLVSEASAPVASGSGTVSRDPAGPPPATRGRAGPPPPSSQDSPRFHARGWGYGVGAAPPPGSADAQMTAGCLGALVMAREGLRRARKLDADADAATARAAWDGLAWLARHPRVDGDPTSTHPSQAYFLFALDKALELLGVERLDGRDWWNEGATALLDRDRARRVGAIPGANVAPDAIDGALELLFLCRATLAPRADASLERGAPWDRVHLPGAGTFRATAVLAALETPTPLLVERRVALADKVLAALDADRLVRVTPSLARLLDAGDPLVEGLAKRWLERAGGNRAPGLAGALVALADASPPKRAGRLEAVRVLLRAALEDWAVETSAPDLALAAKGDAAAGLRVRGRGVLVVPALVRALEAASDAERRARVRGLLEAVTGEWIGEDAGAWRVWWLGHRPI